MLLYIIPFVLLLVVAIVLKKREANNQDADRSKTNKKVSNKKTAKKNVAKSARTSQRQQTQVSEPEPVVQDQVIAVSADLKQKIESLISAKNYSAAEAQINLALNQDNRQHGLYLYLLDIHLAQKDEFAINQLVQYLRSLNLHDIAQQIEDKKTQIDAQTIEVIEFKTSTEATTPTITSVIQNPVPADAFDALVDHKPTNNNSFDLLQNEYSPSAKNEPQPIELADEKTLATPESTVSNEHVDLEFTPSLTTEKVATPAEEKAETENNALAFDLTQPGTHTDKPQTRDALDFSFSLETPTASPVVEEFVVAPENKTPLEFSLDAVSPPTETVTKLTSPVESLSEFKLDLEASVTPSSSESINIDTATSEPTISEHSLDFKLDSFAIEPAPNFNFDVAEPQIVPSLDSQAQSQIQETAATLDPLAQAFPDLLNTNEIELNLDLAEQYITLGAYDAARQLLAQDQDHYSTEQKLQSQNLLNQIAS